MTAHSQLLENIQKIMLQISAQREEILEAFVAKWGFHPEESVQCVQMSNIATGVPEKFWVEKRVPEITPELLEESAAYIDELQTYVNLGQINRTGLSKKLRAGAAVLRNRDIKLPPNP